MMTASLTSNPAPFLMVADTVPEWTLESGNSFCDCTTSTGKETPLSSSSSLGASSFTHEQNDNYYNQSQFLRNSQTLPHLKHCENQILSDLQDKKIFLFLDYDGTLTPIVSDPRKAILSDRMREILFSLAKTDRITVGIVTGRALKSVKHFVQIPATEGIKFLYAASHGFHIEAAGQQIHHQVGARYIPVLRDAALKISKALGHIPGVSLEDNEFAVSVHYRNSPHECAGEIESYIDSILQSYPSLKKTKGKMVFELRFALVWDKGRAVSWLLQAMNVNPEDPDVRLVYIGDDLSDEDAFRTIRQYGENRHLSILVSDDKPSIHHQINCRQTAASLVVKDPDEVAEFLAALQRVSSITSSSDHRGSS